MNEEAQERVRYAKGKFEDLVQQSGGIVTAIEAALAHVDLVKQQLSECMNATELVFGTAGGLGRNNEIGQANERLSTILGNARSMLTSARLTAAQLPPIAQSNADDLGQIIGLFDR